LNDSCHYQNHRLFGRLTCIVWVVGQQAWARGFNNDGSFYGPYMAYDTNDRELTDATRWNDKDEFMCANGSA